MNCDQFNDMILDAIDKELDEQDQIAFEKHMSECGECEETYMSIVGNMSLCEDLPLLDLPENYEVELHEKLLQADAGTKKKININRYNWRKYALVAAVVLMALTSVVNNYDTIFDNAGGKYSKQELDADNKIKVGQTRSKWQLANDSDAELKALTEEAASTYGNIEQADVMEAAPTPVLMAEFVADEQDFILTEAEVEVAGNLEYEAVVLDFLEANKNYASLELIKSDEAKTISIEINQNYFDLYFKFFTTQDGVVQYKVNNTDYIDEYNELNYKIEQIQNLEVSADEETKELEKLKEELELLNVKVGNSRIVIEIKNMD